MIEVNLLADRANGRPPKGGGWKLAGFQALDRWILASMAVVAASLACCAVLFLSVRGMASAADGALAAAVRDSAENAASMRELAALEGRLDEVLSRVRVIKELDRRRYRWPRLLHEIAKALPDRAWLTRIEQAEGDGVHLRFRVEGETADNLALTLFLHRLEESAFIRGVRLVSVEERFDQARPPARPAHYFVVEADHDYALADAAAPSPSRPAAP